jgi:hypothetical protein
VSTQVPVRDTLAEISGARYPPRRSTTSAARSQITTARALTIRIPVGRCVWVPPKAARPRASSKRASPVNPAVAAAAAFDRAGGPHKPK